MTEEVFPSDGIWSDESEWDYAEGDESVEAGPQIRMPVLAVVGRPNVGKSTLVNRIIGRREAVVEDVPGVTRDRVSYDAEWSGRRFQVQDTGGWEPDAKGMHQSIAQQSELAMRTADAILLVVDAVVGVTATDEAAVKVLRRSKTPVLLVANKVDDARTEMEVGALWSLGLGEPIPVSATHGRGTGDLMDKILEALPTTPRSEGAVGGPRRVALVGKPNVGKSSLMNKLTGDERSVVHDVAGTTVDPVDSLVELGGKVWRFVDTAGLRKKVSQASGTEFYASLRTRGAIEAAELAILLIDASLPITEQDLRVLSMVADTGRALVIAFNKWDLVDEDRRYELDREIDREFERVPWASRVNISAKTGRAVQKLVPAMDTALESWDKRVSTGRLNQFLKEVISVDPATGPQWQAAACSVRDAGGDSAADVRVVHDRIPRGRLSPVHRAQAARDFRFRRKPDPDLSPDLREAGALSEQRARERDRVGFGFEHRIDMSCCVGAVGDVDACRAEVKDQLVGCRGRNELIAEGMGQHDRSRIARHRNLEGLLQFGSQGRAGQRSRDDVFDVELRHLVQQRPVARGFHRVEPLDAGRREIRVDVEIGTVGPKSGEDVTEAAHEAIV